jgi:SAM-dependent methyltransferase
MHDTAANNAREFFERYLPNYSAYPRVIELGVGQDRTIRDLARDTEYYGVDTFPGPHVDVVLSDPYVLPFDTGTVDIVIASSVYEHTEWFWVSFVECMRVLKPGGLMYIQVPSNGPVHRFPVDCWRFYPDSAEALARWARHNQYPCEVLESKTTPPIEDIWYDYVAIFKRT